MSKEKEISDDTNLQKLHLIGSLAEAIIEADIHCSKYLIREGKIRMTIKDPSLSEHVEEEIRKLDGVNDVYVVEKDYYRSYVIIEIN